MRYGVVSQELQCHIDYETRGRFGKLL